MLSEAGHGVEAPEADFSIVFRLVGLGARNNSVIVRSNSSRTSLPSRYLFTASSCNQPKTCLFDLECLVSITRRRFSAVVVFPFPLDVGICQIDNSFYFAAPVECFANESYLERKFQEVFRSVLHPGRTPGFLQSRKYAVLIGARVFQQRHNL